MVNTDPCGVYGQVTHSNPDMDSVEDLEAEFMSALFFFAFCLLFFLLPKKNTYKGIGMRKKTFNLLYPSCIVPSILFLC